MEHIGSSEVLKVLVDSSGKSRRQISRELGRFDTYIQTTLGKQTVPGLSVTSQICKLCGYELVLREKETGNERVIDPS